MDIEYLHTLKVITESDSFAKAAEKLGYTRSTVTFHVQNLEKEFGFRLFEKIGKKMVLTKKGEEVLPYVDNILLNYQEITKLSSQPQHKVCIAIVESYLVCKFQNVIKEVRRLLPEVELDVQIRPCSAMFEAIQESKIDLAIHYDVWGRRSFIHTEPINTYPLILFGSNELDPDTIPEALTGSDSRLSFIDLEENGFYQHCLDHLLQQHYHSHMNTIVMGSVASLIQCVKSNLGVAILPEFAILPQIEAGEVQQIKVKLEPDTMPVAVSYHQNKWLSPTLKTVLQIIKETAG
jgi:DNA-binding transcriptional LysR family regulator